MNRLAALRLRLTVWYGATFGLILVMLGSGLFVVIRSQISRQLDVSLAGAAQELMRAAGMQELEAAGGGGGAIGGLVFDAVDQLHIPERSLFLFDGKGNPVKPLHVDSALLRTVVSLKQAPTWTTVTLAEGRGRVYAERFNTPMEVSQIAVAVADERELAGEYAALIFAFAVAALVALLLVAGGGYVLVRQSTAPIERTIEYMRRFMADAAHELRTPLTILRTRAEVTLQRERDASEYAGALGAIAQESERLGHIVEDLLLLSRADAGERPLQREKVFLDDLVLDVAGGAGLVAERRGVTLTVDPVAEAEVHGDATLLRQLISNLVDNAVKFTPAGGTVTIGVESENGESCLSVEDTGVGIPSDQLPHIFQRFFRGDPARTRAEGAGLGLAIVRWVADAHGARIDVKSRPGAGTRIAVIFPS